MAGLGRAFVWVGDLVGLDCKDLENRLDLALLSWRFGFLEICLGRAWGLVGLEIWLRWVGLGWGELEILLGLEIWLG